MPIIKIRRGTSEQWSTSNKVLQVGELGIDVTLNKIKAGNGLSLWPALPWLTITSEDLTTQASTTLTAANEYTDDAVASLGDTVDGSYVPISDVGNAGGVASLGLDGKIPDSEIPDSIARDTEIITSYNDLTDKPTLFSGSYDDLNNKPTIPSLTGYATETYVNTAVSNIVDTAPEALNTLNELAAAINDDASFASTVTTALGNKLDSSTASSTYLTQASASSTYATQTALSTKLDTSSFTYESITIPVYNSVGELPSASTNHGRWAHVHGEGAMYYAHGGSWYRALSQDDLYISANAQSSSYTLTTSDLGKMIEMSNGGTLTITDSSSFPVGFSVDILQTGSSQVTIAGNGFTPNATPGLKLRTQWSSATIVKRALNSWVVFGDLSA